MIAGLILGVLMGIGVGLALGFIFAVLRKEPEIPSVQFVYREDSGGYGYKWTEEDVIRTMLDIDHYGEPG